MSSGIQNTNTAQEQRQIIESKILVFDNVLPPAELDAFICLVERWQSRFISTETGDDKTRNRDVSKRDSLVLFDFEPLFSYFRTQLYRYALPVEEELAYRMELQKGFECQLTAHNDGHFYSAHTDFTANTGTRVSLRDLTFVYYFNRQPKGFSGGELYLWDHYNDETDPLIPSPQGKIIEPVCNRLIFFKSKYWHEVRPISCPSGDFMDSRFTLNGWFHK